MKIVEYAGDKEDFVLAKIIRTSFDADTACHLGADKRDGYREPYPARDP